MGELLRRVSNRQSEGQGDGRRVAAKVGDRIIVESEALSMEPEGGRANG